MNKIVRLGIGSFTLGLGIASLSSLGYSSTYSATKKEVYDPERCGWCKDYGLTCFYDCPDKEREKQAQFKKISHPPPN